MDAILFCLPFFAVALLYASVGHGGASGYLAVMALLSVEVALLRPTALGLNVAVSLIGTVAFFRAGYFSARLFLPLALAAIPFAYLGGALRIDEGVFRYILGAALCVALLRLFISEKEGRPFGVPKPWLLAVCGAIMGILSGLVGVGGGIFLTPLVILLRWGSAKTAAAISAPFILLNSIAGLLGLQPSPEDFHPYFAEILGSVLIGGLIGSTIGSGVASSRQVRIALALVLAVAAFKLFL
ncbi:MAG: sulfite exporter TauE/SafE family protein [Opitutales bacterium]|jgi:uncharacterized membrane protein YfcA